MKKVVTKNDAEWEELFNKFKIKDEVDNKGLYIIKSSAINEFREARLMTKFDNKSQLPNIFIQNNLSLLPISRGEYIISKFKIFHEFEEEIKEVNELIAPVEWESLEYNNIRSEASAINCAYVGLLLNDFLGEETLFPTVNGRMSSLEFDFLIDDIITKEKRRINVRNSQIEIDGGFEGNNSFCLVEAKNNLSPDFLVRQLYYPYRLWENRINKEVRNIFLTYTNGIFHFREYRFLNLKEYNSLNLVKQKKYRFKEDLEENINTELLKSFLKDLSIVEEPEIPFPQADSFKRVINLCEIIEPLGDIGISKEELLTDFYFKKQDSLDARQVNYYTNAAAYLGFVRKGTREDNTIVYLLTEEGNGLFIKTIKQRQIEFIRKILEHNVFKKVLEKTFEIGRVPSREEVVIVMKESDLHRIGSEATYKRRSSTITSWIDWILEQLE